MSERTPLLQSQAQGLPLPGTARVVHDHPIFLRACHSPWSGLNQNALTYIRGFVVVYLTAVGGMLIDFKIDKKDDEHTAWRIIFQFSALAFLLLWLYHGVVFSWTFTHLHYPDIEEHDRRWESTVLRFMSPPTQTSDSRRRLYFSLFYTVTHVFVLMNALIYWTVLATQGHGHLPHHEPPSGRPLDDFFAEGWFKPFCILNLWGGTALVAFIEIFFLNSIKRQIPVATHTFALMFFTASWLGWAAIGKLVTGHNAYFWLDPEIVGHREIVAAYCAGFVGMAPTVFAFTYGLTGMRENLTKKDGGAQASNNFASNNDFVNSVAQGVQQGLQRHSGQ